MRTIIKIQMKVKKTQYFLIQIPIIGSVVSELSLFSFEQLKTTSVKSNNTIFLSESIYGFNKDTNCPIFFRY